MVFAMRVDRASLCVRGGIKIKLSTVCFRVYLPYFSSSPNQAPHNLFSSLLALLDAIRASVDARVQALLFRSGEASFMAV